MDKKKKKKISFSSGGRSADTHVIYFVEIDADGNEKDLTEKGRYNSFMEAQNGLIALNRNRMDSEININEGILTQ
jgi:hypothetical protein